MREFVRCLDRADAIVSSFLKKQGLSARAVVGRAHIVVYPSQDALWRAVSGTPEGEALPPLPRPTLAGASGDPIRVVTPEAFVRIVPEYVALRRDAWTRLIAHEEFHLAFEELLPDAQNIPMWFSEGLAVVAADQGFGEDIRVGSLDEALQPIDWNDRHAYAPAAAHVRYLLKRFSLQELLAHARTGDLEAWLRLQKSP
jgi:hypothetical protein